MKISIGHLAPRETSSTIVCLCALTGVLLLFSSLGVNAADPAPKAPAKSEKAKAPAKVSKAAAAKLPAKAPETTPKVVVTGSRIPRPVKGSGNVRESTSPVYIVDRKEIERSGAMTVSEAIHRLPFSR